LNIVVVVVVVVVVATAATATASNGLLRVASLDFVVDRVFNKII